MEVLDEDFIRLTCRAGEKENACSFLCLTPDGFVCAKGTPVEHTFRERRKNGELFAKGNHCSGPPKYVEFPTS